MFHLLDQHGVAVQSFGSMERFERPPFPNYRLAFTGSDLWSSMGFDYDFAMFDGQGVERRRIRADRPWFTATDDRDSPTAIGPIHVDAKGLLWVTGLVSVAGWRDRLPGTNAPIRISADDFALVRSGIIEVVDPAAGRIVASTEFAGFIQAFVGDGRIAAFRVSSDGVPRTEIWRISLVGYPPTIR
jgi:hypothetical protein